MEFSGLLQLVRNGQGERIAITVIDKTGLHLSYGTVVYKNKKWQLLAPLEHVNEVKGIEDFNTVPSNMAYLSMCEVDSIGVKDGVIKASIFVF